MSPLSSLMMAMPEHAKLIKLRFEDMVFNQDETLAKLEGFLGIPMAKIEMRPDSVGRWKTDEGVHMFEFFEVDLGECGYE